MTYARGTTVPVERSRAEIERLLQKYGATQFNSGWDEKVAYISFTCHGKGVVFMLPLPDKTEKRFTHSKNSWGGWSSNPRDVGKQYQLWEQACRENWRALLLVIKAKLEAVETKITTFEQEFMAHILLPGSQQTIGDALLPRLEEAYKNNTPLLLTERPQ